MTDPIRTHRDLQKRLERHPPTNLVTKPASLPYGWVFWLCAGGLALIFVKGW